MQKSFSIFLVSLILSISIQMGVATHFCGGELAQIRIVFGHGEANCGMDCKPPSNGPNHQETSFLKLSCCQDFVFISSVDEYQSVSHQTIIDANQLTFSEIKHIFTPHYFVVHTAKQNISPHQTSEVFLPFIQVFLI